MHVVMHVAVFRGVVVCEVMKVDVKHRYVGILPHRVAYYV